MKTTDWAYELKQQNIRHNYTGKVLSVPVGFTHMDDDGIKWPDAARGYTPAMRQELLMAFKKENLLNLDTPKHVDGIETLAGAKRITVVLTYLNAQIPDGHTWQRVVDSIHKQMVDKINSWIAYHFAVVRHYEMHMLITTKPKEAKHD